jgi:tetratricopeptide (TPR) repeat protein
MKARAAALALLGLWGCATPLDQGEEIYRTGDRRGALEFWRTVPADDPRYAETQQRIDEVEGEFAELVQDYQASARQLEAEGRLADALLNYRLALALEPDDPAGWAHVQQLARQLLERKASGEREYRALRASGDLAAAETALKSLRALDPLDPEFEIEQRQLEIEQRQIEIEQRQIEEELAALEERRQRIRARQQLAGEVEGLIEAGRNAFAEERLETALVLWRQAQQIDPRNKRIHAYIARAERELDKLERVREQPAEVPAP